MPPGTFKPILYLLLFREVDAFGTNHPVLIVRVPSLPAWDADSSSKGCTLLIPFQDPSNVGAVIRSAAAFGVTKLVMLEEAAHPFHYKSTRAGGTALFRVPISYGPSIQVDAYCDQTGATICGRHAIGVLLRLWPEGVRGRLTAYDTSGRMTGDFTHTVSYAGIAVARVAA